MKTYFLAVMSLFLWNPPLVRAADEAVTFFVKHDHLFGSGHGWLTINEEGVVYNSEKDEKHFRRWSYSDIQQIRIESPTQLQILTYEDIWWRLGRDRRFQFQLVDSQISPELVQVLRHRLPAVVVSTVFSEPQDIFYMIPAKHRHSLGAGCEGQLLFAESGIYYSTPNEEHNRFWPVQAIESLGRGSDFSFRITVREQNLFGGERNFQFQLKRPMNQDAYERLWRTVYEPESWLNRLKAKKPESLKTTEIRFEF